MDNWYLSGKDTGLESNPSFYRWGTVDSRELTLLAQGSIDVVALPGLEFYLVLRFWEGSCLQGRL